MPQIPQVARTSLLKPEVAGQICMDRSLFIDLMHKVCRQHMEEGVETEALLKEGCRFRVRETPYSLQGLIGRTTVGALEDAVRSAIWQAKLELEGQQSNADWVIVAWEVTEFTKRIRDRKAAVSQTKWNLGENVDKPQRTQLVWQQSPFLNLRVVFWDIAMAEEMDLWEERTGRKGSPMSTFIQGGRRPRRLQMEHDDALRMIREFYDQPPVDTTPPSKRLTLTIVQGALETHEGGIATSLIEQMVGVPWAEVMAQAREFGLLTEEGEDGEA